MILKEQTIEPLKDKQNKMYAIQKHALFYGLLPSWPSMALNTTINNVLDNKLSPWWDYLICMGLGKTINV